MARMLPLACTIYGTIYQFVLQAMIFASDLAALVSTLLIRSRIFSPAGQLLLQSER
jgi:hypothetical protein